MSRLFYTISRKIMVCLLMLIVLPTIILLNYNYTKSESIIIQKINDINYKMLLGNADEISGLVLRLNSLSELMLSEKTLQDGFNEENSYGGMVIAFQSLFYRYLGTTSDNLDFTIAYSDGRIFSTMARSSIDKQKVLNGEIWNSVDYGKSYYYWTALTNNMSKESGEGRLTLIRLIESRSGKKGILIINCDLATLPQIKQNTQSKLFLLDENDFFLFGTDKNQETELLTLEKNKLKQFTTFLVADKQKWVASDITVPNTSWKLIQTVNYTELEKEITIIKRNTLYLPYILLLLFVIGTLAILNSIVHPIKLLTIVAKKVREGDVGVRVNIRTKDALGELSNNFNLMLDNIQKLMIENEQRQLTVIREERLKNEYRFRMLQSQIQPHFLLNTLNNIKWLATISRADNVADMLVALGRLLEFSLVRKDEIITVGEEIDILTDYLKLQKMAHGDCFTEIIKVDEKTKNTPLPKLLLQPIVENSIMHGIMPKREGGLIRINVLEKDNKLILSVKDNGVGMSEETKEHILSIKTNYLQFDKIHTIGLISTLARLKLHYGERGDLEIESKPGVGTEIRIIILLDAADKPL